MSPIYLGPGPARPILAVVKRHDKFHRAIHSSWIINRKRRQRRGRANHDRQPQAPQATDLNCLHLPARRQRSKGLERAEANQRTRQLLATTTDHFSLSRL